jgi:hypothetical protein
MEAGVATESLVLVCTSCLVESPQTSRYCAACGVSLEGGDARGMRWRGPRRTLIAGAVAVIVGLSAVIATYLIMQLQGATAFAEQFVGPIVNSGLGLAGVDEISLPEDDSGTSAVLIAAFISGFVLVSIGCCLLAIGAVWAVARWAPRRRAKNRWRRAQPAIEQTTEKTRRLVSVGKSTALPTARRMLNAVYGRLRGLVSRRKESPPLPSSATVLLDPPPIRDVAPDRDPFSAGTENSPPEH